MKKLLGLSVLLSFIFAAISPIDTHAAQRGLPEFTPNSYPLFRSGQWGAYANDNRVGNEELRYSWAKAAASTALGVTGWNYRWQCDWKNKTWLCNDEWNPVSVRTVNRYWTAGSNTAYNEVQRTNSSGATFYATEVVKAVHNDGGWADFLEFTMPDGKVCSYSLLLRPWTFSYLPGFPLSGFTSLPTPSSQGVTFDCPL